MFLVILSITGAVISVLVALVTLLKNPSSALHRWLFAFITAANWWILASNINVLFPEDIAIWIVRSTFASVGLASYCMLQFVRAIAEKSTESKFKISDTIILVAILALSFSSLVVESVIQEAASGFFLPTRGIGYLPALALILFLITKAFYILERQRRKVRGRVKTQLNIILIGLVAGTLAGVASNVILPNLTHNTYPGRFAFIAVVIWTVVLVYAVIKHRFLDIRLTIARAFAYVFALLAIVLLYIILVLGVAQTLLAQVGRLQISQYVVETGIALIAAVTFHPLRIFFDKLTRRVFYRDAYDTQEILDRLGKVFTETVELGGLTDRSLTSLFAAARPQFIALVIDRPRKKAPYINSIGRLHHRQEDLLTLTSQQIKYPMTIVDEAAIESPALAERMHALDVAIITRLETSNEKLGFMFFGYKSSGSSFTSQDLDLIRLAADGLSISIQNALRFEEIRDFNETLQNRVDEATAKLRRSNAKLKQLDEAKDEFISMASHQLRTPLTTIKGYLSMVLEGDAGDLQSGQKRLLEEAYSGAQRMVYLIADFLNVSRLRTGKFVLEYSTVNLAHLIGEEIGQLRVTAKSRQLKLQYEAPEIFPAARLDENKIRQVVMNLIDNAIYYSKPGGIIKVELLSDDGHVTFKVKDTGIGVPASEQKDLFEKFYRASNARKVRPDGTGIGLFMIKKVILAHGGSIIFHSIEGQGSTFGFSLPLKAKPQTKELKAESLQRSSK